MSFRIYFLAALVLIGLGGFFFYRYGVAKYEAGYLQCQKEGAALATEAGEQLKNEIQKIYKPGDVDKLLNINGWMREQNNL